jgi:hypothetical protein
MRHLKTIGILAASVVLTVLLGMAGCGDDRRDRYGDRDRDRERYERRDSDRHEDRGRDVGRERGER